MVDEQRQISLATTLLDAGQGGSALAAIAPYLVRHPDAVDALLIAAGANVLLRNGDEALRLAEFASTLAPENSDAYRIAAHAHMIHNRLSRGRAAARAAIDAAPDSWLAHLARAEVDVIGREPSGQGLSSARTAIELAPTEPAAHLALGAILGMDDDPIGAEQHFREALRIDPQNERAKSALTILRARNGGAAISPAAFTDVLGADPQSRGALYNLRLSFSGTLQRFWIFLLLTTIVDLLCSIIGNFSHLPDVETKIHWILIGITVVALIIVVGSIALLRHEVGHRFDRMVGGLVRADPLLGAAVGLDTLAFVVGAAAAVVPLSAQTWTLIAAIIVLAAAKLVEVERRTQLVKARSTP
jgi:Flp pilus assembly protein TadD